MPASTRSQSNKTINMCSNNRVDNESPNSSYVTIISHHETNKNNSDVDIADDLRNRLAALEYDFSELKDKNQKLNYDLQCMCKKLEAKDIVMENLHKTIDKLTANLKKTTNTTSIGVQTSAMTKRVGHRIETLLRDYGTTNYLAAAISTSIPIDGSSCIEDAIVADADNGTRIPALRIERYAGNAVDSTEFKQKVRVVGDSHCRSYSELLKQNMKKDVNFMGMLRPGAKLNSIVKDVQREASHMGKEDFIVVMGGGNDIEDCWSSENITHVMAHFREMIEYNQERRKNVDLTNKKLLDLEQYMVQLEQLELELSKHAENIEIACNIKIYSTGIRSTITETRIILEGRLDIEISMESFNLKTASSLLPSMDGNEDTTKQLVDSVNLYETFLKPEDKKHLINYVLKTRLSENAKIRLNKTYDTVDSLVSDIQKNFITKKSATTISNQLHNAKQFSKSIGEFGSEIEQLFSDLTLAQAENDENLVKSLRSVNEKIALNSFCNGIRNHELRTILKARNCTTLKEAINTAIDEEKNKPSSSNIFSYNNRGYTNYRSNRGQRNSNRRFSFRNKKFSRQNTNYSHTHNNNANYNMNHNENGRSRQFYRPANTGNRARRGIGRAHAFYAEADKPKTEEENRFFRD
ncbi:hypothetical protein MML48_1g03798 [Holotrichia oblita]|uniref:Uncharacterized protein n=1 Tax=Holotrichia oblita TaxID=644536 RepID=A0ACB9TTE7_HOLOL|nr:hypothetical protein MML48_1g03798 [Holotrichia oblita]